MAIAIPDRATAARSRVDGFELFTVATFGPAADSEDWSNPGRDDPPLDVGSVINGRYSVNRILGRGGMGWVYDVEDAVHRERPVALKIVPGLARSGELSALFESEFRTMARLSHPNLARAFDFEQVRGSEDCVITMERIDGVPVDDVSNGRPDWRTVLGYVVQTCRALSYIHSRNVVHHDLKPSNILVDADGTARVIDFGIASQDLPHGSGYRGTPHYMAPEVLMPSGDADHRADLYSLGVTLYQLLTGHLPCPARRLGAVALWALSNEVVLPPDCDAPEWLRDLVRTMSAPDPQRRPRSANAVIEAINLGGGSAFELETAETRQSYVLTPRFAGRKNEQAAVLDFMERRLEGGGVEPALLVAGTSGIGKSRLMREVRQQAQLRRIVFLESNCYEGIPAEFGPVADLLMQLVPVIEQVDPGGIVRRALPELVRIAPDLGRGREVGEAPPAATVEDERARLLEEVSTFLVEAARVVPFAFYVNDLQWSARGSCHVFAHLAERIRDDESHGRPVPLALLGTYRTEETQGRPLGSMLRRVRDEATAIELTLSALEPDDVGEIVKSMLGLDQVPEAFLTRVAEEVAGNPFFVQELMRMLLEDGTVYLRRGRWAIVGNVGDLALPSTVAETLRRRFGLLTPAQQDVLRVLATQARPMSLDLLGVVLDNVYVVPETARQLSDRGLIVRAEGGATAYGIAHDRMRETIYGDLQRDERRAWHRRLGDALEARSQAERGEELPLDELAHHYWHGAVPDKALEYAVPAGIRAKAQLANQAAYEHFSHALTLLDPEDERHAVVLEHRADMLVRLVDYEGAQEAYHTLLGILKGQVLAEARINGKLADIHTQSGQLEQAVEYGWRALSTFGERRPAGNVGWTLATIGLFLCFVLERLRLRTPKRDTANIKERVAAYDRLFRAYFLLEPRKTLLCPLRLWRIAGVSTDPEAMACAKRGMALMIGIAGMRRWAFDLFEEARRDADSAGSPWWSGNIETRRAMVARMAGRWELEPLELAVEALQDAGDMFELGLAVYHAIDVLYHAGDIDEALLRAHALNSASARIEPGGPVCVQGTRLVEGSCRALQGEDAEHIVDGEYRAALAIGDVVIVVMALTDWGELLVRGGRLDEGLEKLEEAYDIWRTNRLLDGYSSAVLHRLAHAYLQHPRLEPGRRRRLRRIHRMAMRKTWRMHRQWRSPTLVNQALLKERAGRVATADERFQEAIDVARRQSAGLFVSKALYEWGAALMARGETEAARARLQASLDMAEAGGNRWLAGMCRGLL